MVHWLTKQLISPDTFKETIEVYALKKTNKLQLFSDGLRDLSFDSVLSNKDHLAELLADLFTNSQLEFGVLNQRVIERNNKKRVIYHTDTLENIVEATIFRLLFSKLRDYGMPGLYGCFPGTSPFHAMQAISQKLKHLSKDILILRTDIVSYFDSIPIDNSSQLWSLLDQFLHWIDPANPIDNNCYKIIKSMIQPYYRNKAGEPDKLTLGVPTGRPISTFVQALYLRDLDVEMCNLSNGLYTRYGDDIIWLTNNIEDFNIGDNILTNKLAELQLPRHPLKEHYYTLTKSGAKYDNLDKFQATREIEYLGLSILRNGKIRLSLKNFRKLTKRLENKIKGANRLINNNLPLEAKIKIVVRVINIAYIEDTELSSRLSMLKIVYDHGQLKELDFFVASRIVMICSNVYKIAILKKYSYYWLRTECGLVSLCMDRYKK